MKKRDMKRQLEYSISAWTDYASIDPLYYICTDREKRGGKWLLEDFMDLGKREVNGVLSVVQFHFNIERFDVALDLGCGIGRLSFALASHFTRVIGVDVAEPFLEYARLIQQKTSCHNVEFLLGNGYDLKQISDRSIDFALSLLTFQHLPSRDIIFSYLNELVRVLRPGGVMCIQLSVIPPTILGYIRWLKFLFLKKIYEYQEKRGWLPKDSEQRVGFMGTRISLKWIDRWRKSYPRLRSKLLLDPLGKVPEGSYKGSTQEWAKYHYLWLIAKSELT
jgi:SAM-dependent methyltransferase